MLSGILLATLLSASQQFSTYTGTRDSEASDARMIVDASGEIHVYGTLAALNDQRSIVRLDAAGMVNRIAFDSLAASILSVHSDASGNPRGRVAPLSIVRIAGLHLPADPDASLAVLWDDTPATILSTNPIRVIAPQEIQDKESVTVRILQGDSEIASTQIFSVAAIPELYAEVLNPDGSVNSQTNPAPDGGVVRISGTGFGLLPSETFTARRGGGDALIATATGESDSLRQFDVELHVNYSHSAAVRITVQMVSGALATPGVDVYVK